MDHHDIARTLTDVSDALLLDADRTVRRRSPIKLRRIAAVAAIIAMLAVTVGAAAAGITWTVERVERDSSGLALDYYKDYDGTWEGDELQYTVPLSRVELSREATNRVRDILWRYWTLTQTELYVETHDLTDRTEFLYDSSEADSHMETYLGRYNPTQSVEPSYTSLEQIEELLGLTLDISPELREAARTTVSGISLRIYTGYTVEETAQRIEEKIFPEPTQIIINFELKGYAGNGRVHGTIVLPLTEAEAQQGISGMSFSHENEGAIWQTTETCGSREVFLFGNDPSLGFKGFCEAVYASDCGGYILSADIESPDPGRSFPKPTYDTAKEMLLPLLENLE